MKPVYSGPPLLAVVERWPDDYSAVPTMLGHDHFAALEVVYLEHIYFIAHDATVTASQFQARPYTGRAQATPFQHDPVYGTYRHIIHLSTLLAIVHFLHCSACG